MKKTKQYRSPLMASIHETAEGLHAAGLMNKLTLSGNVFADIGFTPTEAPRRPMRSATRCAAWQATSALSGSRSSSAAPISAADA